MNVFGNRLSGVLWIFGLTVFGQLPEWGLTQTKVLTCFASPGFFIDCSLKQAFDVFK